MIVEDERITALEIQSRLEKKGYYVSAIVASGAEAIEEAQKGRPDLVLMDIHLKGDMDGVQAAETLHERFDIPVIYISAYAEKKTLERAKITGPFGYVLKPIDDRELNATIEMALYKHKIERDLREAGLRYRTVADYTYDWEYWVDPEGNFIYVSPSCERITGYPPEEFIKDRGLLMKIVHPDDHELLISHEQKESKTAEPCSVDFRITDRSGNEHWIGHCCQSVYGKDRKNLGRRGSNRDITGRKRVEEERKQYLKALSAKNEELQNVVYVASHDLRTPLVNIQGFAGELVKSCEELSKLLKGKDVDRSLELKAAPLLDEDIPESLKFIDSSVGMMTRLLDGLLRISRVGSAEIKTETVEMDDLMKNVQQSLEFQIQQSGATVRLEKLPVCYGDIGLLNQVFSNLLDNAIKYLDDERKGKITISARIEDNNSIYCIEDNGIGIDRRHHDKVFQIFHRLDPDGEVTGEGLGLSAVWRILSSLDGTILVESEPGKGSRFLVTLPNA